jgi:hypothetical protein
MLLLLFMSMRRDDISALRPPTGLLFMPQVIYEHREPWWDHIVTFSQVLFHNGSLLHSKSQYTTVKHSRRLLEQTYTSDPHSLGTPTPVEFFQQDLLWQSSNTRLQSESFQTHVGTIHRRAIGPLAHHSGTSAYSSPSLTCHLPAPTIGCLHSNDSLTTLSSVQHSALS